MRRFAVGFDGSANSRKAISFIARLKPPTDNHVALVGVIEHDGSELALRHGAAPLRRARRRLESAARRLERRGWRVATQLQFGAPLELLLDEAARSKAQVLAVGAQGKTLLERVVLGSVASGALDQSRLPVLIAR